jgi:predicted nuclease of predicted toxin-antitoxin system
MRLLLDQGLAPSAAAILRRHGFDAMHVSEVSLDHADDVTILNHARS